MKKKIFRLILFYNLFLSFSLGSDIHIKINQGSISAKPIGIIPFEWIGSKDTSENIEKIISNDLRNSGKFNPIDADHLPKKSGNINKTVSQLWLTMNIDTLIVGKIVNHYNKKYIVSYQLIDIIDQPSKIIIENQYEVEKKWLRNIAHSISDEIFEILTGIKGVFRTKIAYISKKEIGLSNQYELNISDYDGYNKETIFQSSRPIMSPSWSPDGKKIAYVSFEEDHSSLVIQTLKDGTIQKISDFPNHNGSPSFSPDGKKIAFVLSKTGNFNLYVMDISSKRIHRITEGKHNDTEPNWFSDNKTIAYTSDQEGNPQIYRINIEKKIPKRISCLGWKNQNSKISFDNQFIVMVNQEKGDQQHIIKLDLTNGSIYQITNTFLDESPSISPNGIMLVYNTAQGKDSNLWITTMDGKFRTNLSILGGNNKFPTWSPYL